MKTYVLYHRDQDGFGAAWAAHGVLGDGAEYISVQYKEPVPEIDDGSTVYIVDFSYEADLLTELADRMTEVVVIDHHSGVQDVLKSVDHPRFTYIFDNDKSGCVLTWEYFNPGAMVPQMLLLIEDRDLWRFKIIGTRALFSYLSSYKNDFDLWDEVAGDTDTAVRGGRDILRYQQKQVDNMVKYQSYFTELGGYSVAVCNTPILESEVGNEMCKAFPNVDFAVIYSYKPRGKIRYSLRSIGDFDVSAIARAYGGNGHKNSAGFMVDKGTPVL